MAAARHGAGELMHIINVRNVHAALPAGLALLDREGINRDSRNGPVRMMPDPVTTIYNRPIEKVVFWQKRDANPFLHLYESLWMLAGRNDVAPLLRYAKNFSSYTDDGQTLWGAYGHRWRKEFWIDQLFIIADRLRENPEDRRSVLQMWDAQRDLGRAGKDVPCNMIVSFQRDLGGRLDMTVFNRSNDIIWGAYGANAVHFAFLQEYLAVLIGCPMGKYRQVSVNWHAYVDTLKSVDGLAEEAYGRLFAIPRPASNPYTDGLVHVAPMSEIYLGETPKQTMERLDSQIAELLHIVDGGFRYAPSKHIDADPFFQMAFYVLKAHHEWKVNEAPKRFYRANQILGAFDRPIDWVVAAREWIARRQQKWEAKQ